MPKKTSEPTNTNLGEIKVATMVCRYLEGTYTNGVVCGMKTNTRGKQKVQYTVYSILFEDNEKLNCGLQTARDMHACYVSRSKARVLPPDGTTKSTKSLAPDEKQKLQSQIKTREKNETRKQNGHCSKFGGYRRQQLRFRTHSSHLTTFHICSTADFFMYLLYSQTPT
jgi:hypothetical protein